MAPLGRPVPSPRARALRAGRGGPRGPGACRRRARGSSRHELEAVLDVANFPAARLDFVAQTVGFTKVSLGARNLPLLGQRQKIRRRVGGFGERAETEEVESPAQGRGSAARAP